MKINRLTLALAIILGLSPAYVACRDKADAELAHHHHHHDHEAAHAHHHGEEDEDSEEESEDEIQLSPSMAEQLGVKVDTIEPGKFTAAIKVSGLISPSSESAAVAVAVNSGVVTLAPGVEPGASIAKGARIATINPSAVAGGDSNAAAKAALDAAKRELDRLTPLHEQRLITASAYNEAVRAYEDAKAAYSSSASSSSVTSPIAGTIQSVEVPTGGFAGAGEAIATIVSDATLTLTANLPVRYSSDASRYTDALIVSGDNSALLSSIGGRRLTSTGVARGGFIPLTFAFNNNGQFVPGQAVEVYLKGSVRDNVISLPVTALTEQQGRYFVYERLDAECYRKVPVTIGNNNGERVEILSGVEPGQIIVTDGAIAVRLAETSSMVPEGHSHNH